MLDYDGTLAPFHIDRFAASPYPGVEDRLAVLSGLPRVHLVLVSGRPARELRGLLPSSTKAEIWGSHGRERLKRDGSYELFALDPVQQATLEQVAGQMTALGFRETLELKPSSLAVHWRSFEPAVQEQIRSLVQSVFARLAEPGNLYLGDDLTDEDAFAAIGDRGFSILVRTEVRESFARFWLRPPEELLGFLDQWIAAAQSQSSATIESAGASR